MGMTHGKLTVSKGSAQRPTDHRRFSANFDAIFKTSVEDAEMSKLTFRNFCRQYYNTNRQEREHWLEPTVELSAYMKLNWKYLKGEYRTYRKTGVLDDQSGL